MIEEISLKNILSFKNEVTFSLEATDDATFESSHVVTMPDGTRLLRLGIVYGANASGKTNLLDAIDWLRSFWLFNPQDVNKRTGIEPFLLDVDTPHQPSEFNIKFWVNGIKYAYRLSVTNEYVIYEALSYYSIEQPVKVFERELIDGQSVLHFNADVQEIDKETQKALTLYCLPNKSFLAARGNVNMKLAYVDDVREWMLHRFMPIIDPKTNMLYYCQNKINQNTDFKDYLLEFLHLADFNITGIKSYGEEKENSALGFEHTVSNSRGEEKYELNIAQQSNGTKRVMGIEAAIYEASDKNAFLIIDEMETSLHPDLMEYIIQKHLLRPSQSQLLITTHNLSLLNTINDLIRKDNVWFVEKDKTGATDLFSLVEFAGINNSSQFERDYRNGKFGALPVIMD